MAYFAMAACGQCNQPFSFNPNLVPSLNNIPFCRTCIEAANKKRPGLGLAVIQILPGAYDIVAEETDTEIECPICNDINCDSTSHEYSEEIDTELGCDYYGAAGIGIDVVDEEY